MSETVRTFVAIRVLPTAALRAILDEFNHFGRSVKAVSPDNLHVTLKFLGNTDLGWIAEVESLLAEIASNCPPFDATLRGLDAFPNPSRPSVVWTGTIPAQPMVRLATAVEESLVTFGFSSDKLELRPHVTLARAKIRPPRQFIELFAKYAETEFATFTVNKIVLMQSELLPQGPRYTPLFVAPFQ